MGNSESEQRPVVLVPEMAVLYSKARLVATSQSSVLITGETGTGKEVLARHIHRSGTRADEPFVVVNCAAVPLTLLESTLFGHERGAFTGAVRRSIGAFEAARGGTLFLDEIGELPPAAQASLLRVLETKRIVRLGSSQEIPVDVRIVSATHRDLVAMVAEGTFREDFLYRINVIRLHNPPLRERREEIVPIAKYMLARLTPPGQTPPEIEPSAERLLLNYAWPGNLRELRNAMEHAAVFSRSGTIRLDDLPPEIQQAVITESTPPPRIPTETGDFRSQVASYETSLLLDALRECDWNRVAAAQRLGLPLRTLTWKLHRYGIAEGRSRLRAVTPLEPR